MKGLAVEVGDDEAPPRHRESAVPAAAATHPTTVVDNLAGQEWKDGRRLRAQEVVTNVAV